MPLHKLLKLLLCSLFLLWMSQLCAIKAEGDPFFIVPKYFHIESETSDNGYIEKINLNTGMIEKISVKVPNSQRVDDVIGLAGDDIILRCGVQEGRAFFVNLKNGDFSVDLGITAGDSSEIFVRASPNQNYFAILFGGSVNGVSSNQIWLFERNPLKLEKKIKIKADTVQDTFFVDNVSNAYLSFDEDLAIWSLAHDQELKKINLKAGCQQIVDGKALFMVDDKNKGIVDFDTGNVQSLSPEYGADTLTSDGKWLVTRQYQKSDKSSDDEFSGQITIIDLQRDTRKVVYIDPKIVNYHFETSQDAYYYFDGKFYLFNKQTMAIVELETGKVTIKPLQYKSKVSNTSNVPMEQGQKIKSIIGQYEKSLIDAVNQNNFSIVADLLTPGSNLYQSQQNLVASLNKQRIQEQLLGYEIQDIQPTGQDGVYKVYVHEKVGIQYPDEPGLKALEFDWIYTVETQGGKMGLSGIEKWVRN